MKNLSLITLCPSHYRKRIYKLLDDLASCKFVFGKNDSSVKSLDISLFRDIVEVPNVPIGFGRWYKMPGALRAVRNSDIVINDMGILCVTSWKYMIYAKFSHQKVYLWDHGWYGREGFIKKWMKRLYFGLADGAFIYGNYGKQSSNVLRVRE